VRQTRIVVVDDHPLFRQGLATLLARQTDLSVVGEAGSAAEAIALARRVEIDAAILDVLMPVVSGISLATDLRKMKPRCKILALSVVDEPGLIADMLRAGASGFALKTQPASDVLAALRHVLAGRRYLPPALARDAIERELDGRGARQLQRLTKREREIFELLIRGHRNDDIAEQLYISRRTVETHRTRINKKLSDQSIAHFQRLAARHGGFRR
jgi:DNA-binding NarL/FixJ family response regulator